MVRIGYHCSHEQFAPGRLLDLASRVEDAGFEGAMCSEHFMPWSVRQGQSGFAWSWLGAAMQATRMTFGTVNAPGQRYHPAIVAQAAAMLETPEQFDQASEYIGPEQVRGPIRVSSDLDRHADWIRDDIGLGFDEIYLHHVGHDQEGVVDAFGRHVLTQIERG
jgi:coenzyme F420-dependent glucose-6-phosphate dehydrogenase